LVLSLTVLSVILGTHLFDLPTVSAEPFVVWVEKECVPLSGVDAAAFLEGPSFDFVDHELAYAGGYSLCAVVPEPR
jgi:hypothetical protein